ncbi:TIGR02300 family protein [Cohaesibacter marisflavi]|uniref:TIGR02300 family protein n=1 Tax=Cohaesibacter marisflavi TaxID=655353 RepID=A0A1I5CT27_9HYPH|nr:TIGR02300 family protein [Cohaesibacter marisflavi]SFN90108.1 TIGR02300 family protein [Cohaesibacter marisflavi]
MARPELGTKRVCADCGAKYYDLNRDPIVCPKCGTIYELAKPLAAEVAEVDEKEEEVVATTAASDDDGDAEVISLEDADAEQASDIDVPDLDDDDNSDDADVFLDDEEDEEALDAIGLDVAVPNEDDE